MPLPVQNQQGNQDNSGGHCRAQQPHQDAHIGHRAVNLCGVVADHKDPAPVLEVFVDHQLIYPIFVPVGVCIGLGAAVLPNPPEDFLIAAVSGFGVQEGLVLVVEIAPPYPHSKRHTRCRAGP